MDYVLKRPIQFPIATLKQHASEIKIDPIPNWEDSPQLAAGYASIFILHP
jgi:hypothetical protein